MTGRHMRDHTDVVIHSAETEIVRLANLPLKQCWSGPWTKTSSTVGKTTTHASLPLLIGPTMLCCLAKILPREKPCSLTMAQLQVSFLDSTSTKSFYVELLNSLRGPATSVQVFTVNFWLNLHFWYWPVLRTKQAFSSWLLAYRFLRLKEILNHILIYSNGSSCTHSNLGEEMA